MSLNLAPLESKHRGYKACTRIESYVGDFMALIILAVGTDDYCACSLARCGESFNRLESSL